jgi:hypothetical protein
MHELRIRQQCGPWRFKVFRHTAAATDVPGVGTVGID